ncbi:MAG: FHA domain-containing protein [Bacteroidales bacterium]|nr:FHA domain-containing protein [Bacteroidales bacterium]
MQIPDDSAYCDQCGKELKWCPECKRPKRGTECPVCGSDLIPGRKYLAMTAGGPAPAPASGSAPAPASGEAAASPEAPRSQPRPTALVGNGWRLTLRPGEFGRRGGIWPELSTCPYVSGNHGFIGEDSGCWKIQDRGSTNGTYINGVKITPHEWTELRKGDRLRIATLDFTVE